MYLKSLQMQGFKSFVDKISIDFTSGITAVVGPNGSGKSNISDAIRWVMGEQSAKSLRGGSMQDVIFAGTKKRRPLGFAEVSLVVDNSKKKLPIDYEEVMVTRRVFRSGESEYLINKSPCRLKDIHQLFMDTGVGKDGYSVIGQGQIAEIINSKPEDRRQIFEEAAGITKYRYRKEEAQRKLAHTEENILRVNDIISEIETQLEPLGQQSEKAKKYLLLKERLKVLEVNVSLENTERCKSALGQIEQIYAINEKQLCDIGAEIGLIEKKTEQLFNDMRQNEENADEKRQRQQQGGELLSNLKKDIAVLENRIEQNCDSIKKVKEEIGELTDRLFDVGDSLAKQGEGTAALAEKEKQIALQIEVLDSEIAKIDEKKEACNVTLQAIKAEIAEKENEIASKKALAGNYTALIESYNTRVCDIEREIQDKEKLFADAGAQLHSVQHRLKETAEKEALSKRRCDDACRRSKVLGAQLKDALEKSTAAESKLQQAQAREKLLADMEGSFDNYTYSVKSVMRAKEQGKLKGLHSTVAQILQVPEKYAVAIETALGSAAQNIVANTEEDSKAAIAFLKETKSGRATFLPISAARGGTISEGGLEGQKGILGIASDIVQSDPIFKNVVQSLLGRVVVADCIDNAVAAARKYNYRFRIVTLEGELLTPGGAMSGGSRRSNLGFFTLANELKGLKTAIVDLKKYAKEAAKKADGVQSELAKSNELEKAALEEVAKLQQQSAVLAAEVKHAKDYLNTAEQTKKELMAEKQQTVDKINKMEHEISADMADTGLISTVIENLEDKLRQCLREQGALEGEYEAKRARAVSLKIEHSNVTKDIQLHHERVDIAQSRKKEIEYSIEQKQIGIDEILEINEDLKEDIEFKNGQIEELKAEAEKLKQEISALSAARRDAEEEIKQKQAQLTQKRETQLVLQQEQGRTESKKARAESELENIINGLWEEYELTISSAEQYKCEIGSMAKAQKEINFKKEEIRALGNINLDAVEEYANIKERFEFLTGQRDDLVQAGGNLEKVIYDIEKIMREMFALKFKDINESFSQVFSELFGGGSAQLVLTGADDILSSGVDIDVQPPGKAVKNMLQLSGGEQAFVSIALLFAILKVRPSPFCIFDEIEAALDEVNVYRFAEYLQRLSADSQFIVVTHRRGTMEAANMLYGVTMQEQGVTSVISLNIDSIKFAKA